MPIPAISPVLAVSSVVQGPVREAMQLGADMSDAWVVAGRASVVIEREYRLLVGGVVVLGPQADPIFMVPHGTGGLTYSYQLRVRVAEAPDVFSVWIEIDGGTVIYALPQPIGTIPDIMLTVDSEIKITGTTGLVTITVIKPEICAAYDAGNSPSFFTVDEAALVGGPAYLVPVRISETNPGVGSIITLTPGFAVYDGNNVEPSITYEWMRDGVLIPGGTGQTYSVQAGDVGAQITVRATATGTNGVGTSLSAPVIIAGSVAAITAIMGDTSGINIDYMGVLSVLGGTSDITLEVV
ncbi:MAG: hypothetical protein ABJ263_15095 [Tateyamaria sp.]|uniref:hypothetical protein n=1 Tax=Tateyamaria sp. TaxID=1929288 RepID=UPI00328BE230